MTSFLAGDATILIPHTIQIDPDAIASKLVEKWVSGQKQEVIQRLSADHAGLTAMVIVTGSADRKLALADCNELTNRLLDARRAFALAGINNQKENDND